MNCPNCGNIITPGMANCPSCGNPVPLEPSQSFPGPDQPPAGAPKEDSVVKEALGILKKCLTTQYCCFEGRMSKREYWTFFIAFFICNIILNIILGVIAFMFYLILYLITKDPNTSMLIMQILQYLVGGIIGLAFVLPCWGAAVRRLHDTGKSGLFVLLNFVCCIGGIIVLIFCLQDGQPEANQYGEVPES